MLWGKQAPSYSLRGFVRDWHLHLSASTVLLLIGIRCWGNVVGQFLHHLRAELLIAMQILLIKVQSEHSGLPQFPPTRYNLTWCNFPSHSPACVSSAQGKRAVLKKTHLFHCARCQPGSFFKRCGVTVVWERTFMSDATRKMVLKQATQRALFTGVTFGIGWSYVWKNVWARNTFPIII